MTQESLLYKVVFNHEEQYSIWPAHKNTPPGWTEEGTVGEKEVCLQHIEKVWTDMRPLSLRNAISSVYAVK
ncbi:MULTISPECIES: MbtH family NRPS accessory protein [Cytobacillus]|jgi:MbtH protein|uniref:Antibiotic synthesis protein MbtH n=1 Tax=Cytobacillus oceanisediminis 2691 TaxID=1196031 RepID=A0A160M786_9BACI|nr:MULTISPECIES: MbtH family NRPS accessory protein [Cytobacillus]AND38330.1 antibiotic synthesis protein MbtH [Cytobacillus oceanisediminis 2691]MBY0156695.1 MbtH family NRPS accessory protein [Cytobacillus firmus]MCM3242108.1 MbtH family NRPS accessory protein [Cytobacillus oceanisediminis]MCM3391193.1 MbtH family NRPS accessory protein [Cytobacillus oceanisediminis]MCM3531436.1 MbtH family NRPS accessory protein [Cytobacillus oceanisediminis]